MCVGVGVNVGAGVDVGIGMGVYVGVGVNVGVGVGVYVGVGVNVGVGVYVGVGVNVGVGMGVGVDVGVGTDEGVEVGLTAPVLSGLAVSAPRCGEGAEPDLADAKGELGNWNVRAPREMIAAKKMLILLSFDI